MADESASPGAIPEPTNPVSTEEPKISIEDFSKVRMQVGQILEAEKIEGSRKLVRMRVDIGSEVRQLVAGIAESYDPPSLVNRKIVVVTNLKPAKLMGVESNGMVVAASVGGKAVLATFSEDVPNGAPLR
jgi:methionyl-tRNA synthetase